MNEVIDVSDLPEEQVNIVREFVAFLKAKYRTQEASSDVETTGEGTLANYLSDYIGILHSSDLVPGGAKLSQRRNYKFTDHLNQKREQGRL